MSAEDESPDARAKRLKEESERALEWVHSKWKKNAACPMCGANAWGIASVMGMVQFENGHISLGKDSSALPVVPVICSNCGYTVFFNALLSGVIPKKSPDSSNEGEGE